MSEKEEYIEIDLKAIAFHVLHQWKRILAAALVLGVLLGGLQAFLAARPVEEEEQRTWTDYEAYQHELSLCQDQLAAAQDRVDTLEDYIENSVMMKADYRNVYVAKTTYYVDSGYQILPENTYQNTDKTATIVWYYNNFLQDYSLYESIAGEVGIEAAYLMDLVNIEVPNGTTLSITVSHPYERSAQQIMAVLQDYICQLQTHLGDTIGEHTLTRMLDSCGVYIDEDLKSRQQEVQNELLTCQQELIECQSQLETLLEGDVPEETINILKVFLKWGLLGGVAGAFVLVLWYACRMIFTSRVYTAGEAANRVGLPVFGSILREPVADASARKLRKLEGRLTENTQVNDCLIAAKLGLACQSGDSILLFSDTGIKESTLVSEHLQPRIQTQLIPCGSLTADASAIEALGISSNALLVVTAGSSRKAEVEKAVALLKTQNKNLLGILFLD